MDNGVTEGVWGHKDAPGRGAHRGGTSSAMGAEGSAWGPPPPHRGRRVDAWRSVCGVQGWAQELCTTVRWRCVWLKRNGSPWGRRGPVRGCREGEQEEEVLVQGAGWREAAWWSSSSSKGGNGRALRPRGPGGWRWAAALWGQGRATRGRVRDHAVVRRIATRWSTTTDGSARPVCASRVRPCWMPNWRLVGSQQPAAGGVARSCCCWWSRRSSGSRMRRALRAGGCGALGDTQQT